MRLVFTFILLLSFTITYSQSYGDIWADVSESQISLSAQSETAVAATEYRVLSVDFDRLVNVMRLAPKEFTAAAKSQPLQIQMPHPNGNMVDYFVVESSVMHPNLQARYPNIRSFKFWNPNNPSQNGRMDYSPAGVNAIFNTSEGKVLIQPYATNQKEYHFAYYLKDATYLEEISSFVCGNEHDTEHDHDHDSPIEDMIPEEMRGTLRNGQPVDLRVYDLALACTGEFANTFGGTTESVMAAFNTTLNLVNSIFENEVAVRVQLIEDNDVLIFLDPATDPYPAGNLAIQEEPPFPPGNGLIQLNTNVIQSIGGISPNDYDLGHVFTGGCLNGIGGIAYLGSSCMGNKGGAVTCFFSSNIPSRALGTMPHEIGHQFFLGHTWSNCPTSQDQFSAGSAYEPGSGSTILSYSGSCLSQNLSGDDAYYHVNSVDIFINTSRDEDHCPTIIPTSNTEPEIQLDYPENGYYILNDDIYIPISTPFELTGSATDVDGDELSYCWEQYNLGPVAPLGSPIGNGPSFRSYPPNDNPQRVFPRLNTILTNSNDVEEVLPTYSRNLSFRFTVRDNNPEAGGTVWEQVDFQATESAGPFLVTYPNATDEVWQAGEYVEVTWDVANTDNNLVDCRFVNILLSTNNGSSFPITLSANTLNDGSEMVFVPNVTANNSARVRIEAADNIFFDVSNQNFDIVEAAEPTFIITQSINAPTICLPGNEEIVLSSEAVLGYDSPITLEVIDGLPSGAQVLFSNNNFLPSEETTVTFDVENVVDEGTFDVTIQATTPLEDTVLLNIPLVIYSNDFSDLVLTTPENGVSDIILGTDFDWTPSVNGIFYDFELATHPSFEEQYILASSYGITNTDYQLDQNTLLEENELYYWRVRAINECGTGAWRAPFAFHTTAVSCDETASDDVPIPISGTGLPTIESSLFVDQSGIISDINIPFMRASYQPVNSIRITLESPGPDPIQVVLFDQNCGNTVNFRLGFDDEAPNPIQCPPDDAVVNQPVGSLSDFIGKNTFGEWKLIMQVVSGGFGGGGGLDEWSIEFCSSLDPKNPLLITNEPLEVPPGQENPILTSLLEVEDEDNTAEELTYNIVTLPQHGTLRKNTTILDGAGDTFTQFNINSVDLYYMHDGSDTTEDSFTFTVEDPTGGWLVTQQFNIVISDDAVVSTVEPVVQTDFVLYPNPAKEELFVKLLSLTNEDVQVSLLNIQGQLISKTIYGQNMDQVGFDVSNLAAGIYLVSVNTATGTLTKKVTITK